MSLNLEKFKELVSDEPSNWLRDAKRRKRWRWFNNLILRPKIKYYIIKGKLKRWWKSKVKETNINS